MLITSHKFETEHYQQKLFHPSFDNFLGKIIKSLYSPSYGLNSIIAVLRQP